MQTNFSAFKAFNTLKYASSTNITNSELSGNQGRKYRSVEWYSNKNYKQKHTLNIIHFNTRSLTKNKSKIEESLQMLKTQPDVIVISESKLNVNNAIRADLRNYYFVHCDSLSNAGGVGLYISSSLSYSKIDEHSWATFHSESLFVEIKLENTAQNLVIGVIYRHPSSSLTDFQNQFIQTLHSLAKHKKGYILCGDYNVDVLQRHSSSPINAYVDSVYAEGCLCLIDKPTRFTPSSATLLDHVYTNIYNRTVTADILLYDISDHLPTMCSLMLKRKKFRVQQKMYRSMANYRKDDFMDEITSLSNRLLTDVSLHPTASHLDNICTKFINEFSFIVNTHAPLKQMSKTKSNQKFKPWLTKGILKSIKTKNKLYANCYKQNNSNLISKYKQHSNKLTTIKRLAKEQ